MTVPSISSWPEKVISPVMVVSDEIRVVLPDDAPIAIDSLRLRMV
jgi:hypothetical protein